MRTGKSKVLAIFIIYMVCQGGFPCQQAIGQGSPDFKSGFISPPDSAKPGVFWWWLNGLVDKEAITRDLEEFQEKGIGEALIVDAGGTPGTVPAGHLFMGTEWRNLFKHALVEVDRCG